MRLERKWIDDPPGELVRAERAAEDLPAVLVVHEQAMRERGKEWEAHVYPGAPHAFFNDTRSFYRVGAARDAWARTLGFFAGRLAA